MIGNFDWVANARRRCPETVAIETQTGNDGLTYSKLDRVLTGMVTSIEHSAPSNPVGIASFDPIDIAVGSLAGLYSSVPVVPFTGSLTEAERTKRIERCSIETIVQGQSWTNNLPDDIDRVRYDRTALEDDAESRPPLQFAEKALLLFTSGTTGKPKAIPLGPSHLYASAVGSMMTLGVNHGDVWLDPLPLRHMGGLAPVFRSVIAGTSVRFIKDTSPEGLDAALDDETVSGISMVPTMLARCRKQSLPPVGSLRFVLVGGGQTDPTLVKWALANDVPIHTTYGMTETASQIATATPAMLETDPETVGPPIHGATVETTADDQIIVDGAMVFEGYWEMDTHRVDGKFLTGDVGRIDDRGWLYLDGRASERITTGGETLAPAGIERELRAHKGIKEIAVVGLPDQEWGEVVCAAVVLEPEVELEELQQWARDKLNPIKLPKQWITVDRLPRTASGTVDTETLRQAFESDDRIHP